MYPIILTLHNIVRWAVIILGIVAAALALAGWLNRRPWSEQMRKFSSYFAMSMDIQILFGLILYFISPNNMAALQNFGAVMSNSAQRFYAIEHPLMMVLAVVFAHLGSVLPRKVDDPRKKYLRAAIFIGLAVVLVLSAIPWDRSPLLRLGV